MTDLDQAVKRVKDAIDGASVGLPAAGYREFLDSLKDEIAVRMDAAECEDDDEDDDFDDDEDDEDSDLDDDEDE